jgi:hypothetical protein
VALSYSNIWEGLGEFGVNRPSLNVRPRWLLQANAAVWQYRQPETPTVCRAWLEQDRTVRGVPKEKRTVRVTAWERPKGGRYRNVLTSTAFHKNPEKYE